MFKLLTWTGCLTVFLPIPIRGTALPNQRMSKQTITVNIMDSTKQGWVQICYLYLAENRMSGLEQNEGELKAKFQNIHQ